MHTLHFSIHIDAPQEKVWNTMLEDATYRQWTKPFNPGSYYEGTWEEGSEIKFLGSDENGNPEAGGMYSMIRESRPYEYVSIEHLGMIVNGVVDTTSDEVKKWTPAFENYSFTEKDGGTDLSVAVDVADEFKEDFNEMWPRALDILKALAEA